MSKNKISVTKHLRLWGVVFLIVFVSIIVGIEITYNYKESGARSESMRSGYVEQQKKVIKREVEHVVDIINYAIAQGIHEQDEEQVKAKLVDQVNNIRFGKNGYIFVDDWQGMSIAHGAQPDLIGTDMWEREDSRGTKTTQSLIAASKKENGGYVSYWWRKPDTGNERPKIGYAKGVPEWEWMIGTGVYLDNVEREIATMQSLLNEQTREKIFISIIIIVTAFTLFLILFNWLSNFFSQMA